MEERGTGPWERWRPRVARVGRRVLWPAGVLGVAGLAMYALLSPADGGQTGAGYLTMYNFDPARPPVPVQVRGLGPPFGNAGMGTVTIQFGWCKYRELFRSVEMISVGKLEPAHLGVPGGNAIDAISASDIDLLRPFMAEWFRRERGAGPRATGDPKVDLSDEVAELVESGRVSMTRTDWPETWRVSGRILGGVLVAIPIALAAVRMFARDHYLIGLAELRRGNCPVCRYPCSSPQKGDDRCPECGTSLGGWRAEAERALG